MNAAAFVFVLFFASSQLYKLYLCFFLLLVNYTNSDLKYPFCNSVEMVVLTHLTEQGIIQDK